MTIDNKKIIWRNVLLFSIAYFAAFYTGMHIAFIRYFDVVNLIVNSPILIPMRDPAWDKSGLHTVTEVIILVFNYGLIGLALCYAISLICLRSIRRYWKEPTVALLTSSVLIFPSKWQFFIRPSVWTPASFFGKGIYFYVANGTTLLIIAILSLALVRKRKQQRLEFDFETNAPNRSFAKVGQTE
jgi:hypothetical protein